MGSWQAADGTRTHDLLHGKSKRRSPESDARRLPAFHALLVPRGGCRERRATSRRRQTRRASSPGPNGGRVYTESFGGKLGAPPVWSLSFAQRPVPNVLSARQLSVTVTTPGDGGTALRADGIAGWVVPRLPSERVPSGVQKALAEIWNAEDKDHAQPRPTCSPATSTRSRKAEKERVRPPPMSCSRRRRG
jgi:hypothetical protein